MSILVVSHDDVSNHWRGQAEAFCPATWIISQVDRTSIPFELVFMETDCRLFLPLTSPCLIIGSLRQSAMAGFGIGRGPWHLSTG